MAITLSKDRIDAQHRRTGKTDRGNLQDRLHRRHQPDKGKYDQRMQDQFASNDPRHINAHTPDFKPDKTRSNHKQRHRSR